MRGIFRRSMQDAPQTPESSDSDRDPDRVLGPYDIAYLVGGPQRVAETALIALHERRVVTVSDLGVRAERQQPPPGHPIERALTAMCPPQGKRVAAVILDLACGKEMQDIGGDLYADGLLSASGRRITRAGKARLTAARLDDAYPRHVFDGPPAAQDASLRRSITEAAPAPAKRGRSLARMAKSLSGETGDGSGWGIGPDSRYSDGTRNYHGSGDAGSCGGGGGS